MRISDTEHQRRYTDAIRAARVISADEFHSWFDKSSGEEHSLMRGYWDFAVHILRDKVVASLSQPEEKIALEIGYGGGRLLNAACSFFKTVIGIDIHDEKEFVEEFLRRAGKDNFQLIRTSGRTINVESESIDFVYSFIVLMHLPSFDVFTNYIEETYRCLKPGGVAQLYFGRRGPTLTWKDRLAYFRAGYKEISAEPVNHISLIVRHAKASALCRNTGFKILDTGTSYHRVPDGYPQTTGVQRYLTLLKP